MNIIKQLIFLFAFIALLPNVSRTYAADDTPVSTKKERNHITKGNKLYEEGKYKDALKQYEEALEENPSSVVARYNAGLSEIRIGSNPNDTSEAAKRMLDAGKRNMQTVANLGTRRSDLASKANYNLGNVAFNSEDYSQAVNFYKQALRLNPEDEAARRNLRIAQLKIQNQDDQNQDQNQNNQEQQQEQQEQEQNQNQDQNQDQNEEQEDRQEQDNQDRQQEQQMNPQVAEQILNAIENKENQTRARVAGQNAEKSRQRNRNRKNW